MTQDLEYDPLLDSDQNEDEGNQLQEDRVIKWHLAYSDDVIHNKSNRPKSDDPGWKYGFMEDRTNQNNVRCLLCAFLCKGGIGRLKSHLMGGDKNILKCPNVPKFISKESRDYVTKKKTGSNKCKGKDPMFIDETEVVDLEDPNQMKQLKKKLVVSGVVSSFGSATFGLLQLKKEETIYDVIQKKKVEKQFSIVDHVKKQEKKIVDHIVSD